MADPDENGEYDLLPTQLRAAETRITELEIESRTFKRLLWAVAKQAGGKVSVDHRFFLMATENHTLTHESNGDIVFRAD